MDELGPTLSRDARGQLGCFLTAQALVAGYSPSEIQQLVRTGRWFRLRRGAYCLSAWWEAADAEARHLAQANAAQLQQGARSPLSHISAALLYELPIIGSPPLKPEITVQREDRCSAPSVHLYTARLFPPHVTTHRNVPVTSAARTISDIARSRPLHHAVATGDAALRAGLVTMDDFDVVLKDCWTWRGIARTKRVIALLDARSESVGESISRLRMAECAIPVPTLQHVIHINGRQYRTDFAWPELRVIGEFDGRVKYGGADDLFEEKRREDALRREGWLVVRWVWDELWGDPPVFVRRLQPVLESRRHARGA